jgi:dienelactone hydrolase
MQTFSSHVDGYYDVADQIADWLRREAEAALEQQLRQKAEITTVAQFEARRAQVRSCFLAAIGGLPEREGSLNAQCTGVIEGRNHTIEKLIYESQPGFYVTAALYLPKGLAAPAPAVVFVHGHHDIGKGAAEYQAVCIDLAHNGFAVLAVDPPGQGERKQYYDASTGQVQIAQCTHEHTYSGLQFVVGGASLARHFIWDVMRGVDYLETRPDVDATRLGITGNSGGGTQTSFLMIADPRFTVAVPCTFIMTLASYMKTGQPQDSEQIVRGCFVDGPDHDDYLTMMAPKPVLVGAAAYDFFPIEGALEAVRRARQVYRLFGAEDRVDITVAPTGHSYSPQLREAAVNWFRVHLQGEAPTFRTGAIETLPAEALWCTPKGQVFDHFPHSRTVFDLNRAWLERRVYQRRPLSSEAETAAHVRRMRQAIPEVLGIDLGKRDRPVHARVIWEGDVDGYRCEKLFFFSEEDIVVTGVIVHPLQEAVQTDIVLFDNGTEEIPVRRQQLQALLAARHRLFIFDVRGCGAVQTRPVNHNGQPHDTEFKLGCDAMMLKRSTLGMRVFDVLRAYDYLRRRADVGPIGLVGVNSGAMYGYFAAAVETGMTHLTFENLLVSYQDLASTKLYASDRYNLKVAAWGLLQHFDLVDLLPCLAPRETVFASLRNARGEIQGNEAFLNVAQEYKYLPEGWLPKFA